VFTPRFILTNKILGNLIEIEKLAQILELASLEPDWETRLKQECLARRAWSVMSFYENQLSNADIVKIILDDPGRDDKPTEVALRTGIVAKEVDMQEAMNWLNANKLINQTAYLSSKFKQDGFSEKDLIALNSLLGERVVSSVDLGEYRSGLTDEMKEIKVTPSVELSYQMEDLFIWIKGVKNSDMHPLIKAGAVLFEIVRMRPFVKNNLMSGLFFFGLAVSCEGLGMNELWAYEEDILKNKQRLVDLVKMTAESGDMTGWFEFLTKSLADSANKTKVKIMNLIGDRPLFKSEMGRTISLTERQILIMEEMTIQNEMTIKEIRLVLPMVSDDTILRDLKDLMSKKLLKKKGKTKGAVYVMGKSKKFR